MAQIIRFAITLLLLGPVNSIAARDVVPDLSKVHLVKVPLNFDAAPLTEVLGRIGVSIDGDAILFGVEVIVEDGREPLVSASIPGGSTLDDALAVVMHAIPGYTFHSVAPHLVNVLPLDAQTNPDDLLNVRIPKLELADVSPSNFLGNPARFIPELRGGLNGGRIVGCEIGPGLSDKAPGITASLTNSTVRDALNRVSEISFRWLKITEVLDLVGCICTREFHQRAARRTRGGYTMFGGLRKHTEIRPADGRC